MHLLPKTFPGSFCTRQVENILDFEISELEDSKDEPAPPKSFINERAIRYADVLLMLAEAYMNKGALDTSIGYINQIRRRANLNDYSGPITKEGVLKIWYTNAPLNSLWKANVSTIYADGDC